ncbi:sensor histidine kinase [Haloplanus aerogenes]|uniref:histidine kinase n=1 Tax=Haloplanus aerogenes TaxID=660522 RepID=A0A3M0DQN4_9EURY|nr:HAMP domain-containing sensor histidine kinase [Haloplanus aerogenes]AZH24532.1 sensor histidine kinase [Haloplanus aerogenes]RMB23815.1 histidine kinase-like protein [Haloplanus aerogenes]
MVSKGDLGVSYLIGVGVVLFGVCSAGVLLPIESTEVRSLLSLSMGGMIAGSFLVTGIGLAQSTLDDDRVWRVAGWSTLGLGLPTLVAVLVILLMPSVLRGVGWRSVVLVNIAAGGVVGVLVGSLLELRAEHERTRTLNQRNSVFLRLFRHDIRTSLNLIRGHLDLVTGTDSSPPESPDVIREQLEHIERLSGAANRLDELGSTTETKPVALGALVRDRLDELRRSTETVTVETDIEDAYVEANDLLSSVVDNLLRNAVEHGSTHPRSPTPEDAVERGSTGNQTQSGDAVEYGATGSRRADRDDAAERTDDPWLRVTVRPVERRGQRDAVELRIEDDGPGFTPAELAVHADAEATETALQHSDGIGLWLVRWIVETYDGEFTVRNADDGGAIATVTLPRADRIPADEQHEEAREPTRPPGSDPVAGGSAAASDP